MLASLGATVASDLRRHDWDTLITSIVHRVPRQATADIVTALVDLVCPRALGSGAEIELCSSRDSVLLQLADAIFALPRPARKI